MPSVGFYVVPFVRTVKNYFTAVQRRFSALCNGSDFSLVNIDKLPEIMAFAAEYKVLVIFEIMYRYD